MLVQIALALSSIASPARLCDAPTHVIQKEFVGEFDTIVEAAEANDCASDQLFVTLLAIRKAENGRPGIEFGVLHPRAVDQPNSLRVQAGWCAATIRKNYKRWIDSDSDKDFIDFLGDRYCPVGADNDPNGLNKHWKVNVRHWIERISGDVEYLKRTNINKNSLIFYRKRS